jgi:hypothetical protein
MIEIYVMDATRTKRVEALLAERVKAKQCVCGCGESTEKFSKLGLSRHCYYEYTESRKHLTKKQAEAYRAKLVREGQLLLPHEIRSFERQSVFSSAAKEVKAAS